MPKDVVSTRTFTVTERNLHTLAELSRLILPPRTGETRVSNRSALMRYLIYKYGERLLEDLRRYPERAVRVRDELLQFEADEAIGDYKTAARQRWQRMRAELSASNRKLKREHENRRVARKSNT